MSCGRVEETFAVMLLQRWQHVDASAKKRGRNVDRFLSAAWAGGYPQIVPLFSTAQDLEQRIDVASHIRVRAAQIGDLAARVQHGRVIAATERFPDIG